MASYFYMLSTFILWFLLAVSGETFTRNFWIRGSTSELIKYQYYKSYEGFSLLRCTSTCRLRFGWDQIYYHDHVCYCLAPNYVSLHDKSISGQLVLQRSAVFQIKHDVSTCLEKGYRVFPCCGYCLKAFTDHKIWMDGENRCMEDGGHLASVETEQKIGDAMSLPNLFDNGYEVYVGGHCLSGTNDNMDYRWISGGEINESLWRTNEPNNLNSEKVVHIYEHGGLNNRRTSTPFSFLCELLTYN